MRSRLGHGLAGVDVTRIDVGLSWRVDDEMTNSAG